MAGVELEGADRAAATTKAAARDLGPTLDDKLDDIGRTLTEKATTAAPRRTGALRKSHKHTVKAGRLTIRASKRYAIFVHAANPWLANTVEANTSRITDALTEGLDDTTDHIKGA